MLEQPVRLSHTCSKPVDDAGSRQRLTRRLGRRVAPRHPALIVSHTCAVWIDRRAANFVASLLPTTAVGSSKGTKNLSSECRPRCVLRASNHASVHRHSSQQQRLAPCPAFLPPHDDSRACSSLLLPSKPPFHSSALNSYLQNSTLSSSPVWSGSR